MSTIKNLNNEKIANENHEEHDHLEPHEHVHNTTMSEHSIYRLQGLSCINCAEQFEEKVKALPGVKDAHVNFGASKIEVTGHSTPEEIDEAGSFDHIKVIASQTEVIKTPFYQSKENIKVLISAFIMLISFLISTQLGSENVYSVTGYVLAIIIGGYSLFITGLKNLFRLRFDINTLMTIAIIGAVILGEYAEGSMVVVLFAISEALETYSMDKARQSISKLMEIAPKEALRITNGKEETVMVEELKIGNVIRVKPGMKIAMDGVVLSGHSAVNQASITGESMPVEKHENDEVFAGTLNEEGLLDIKVTKALNDTTIAKIIHLVEEAQSEKAPSQAFVDRFAKYYTPIIILIAFLVAVIPPLLLNGSWHDWIYQGLAVLVVGCPCALVVSTPVAIVTAIGNAARYGVLIKGGIHLEEMAHINTIAFDKTGTLTNGTPEVTEHLSFNPEHDSLMITASLEAGSNHPLASAIKQYAVSQNISPAAVADFNSITGQGITGSINQVKYYAGSPQLFIGTLKQNIDEKLMNKIQSLQAMGKTVILTGTEKEIISLTAVSDQVRTSSVNVIKELNHMNIDTVMLTGDNQSTADYIGHSIGVTSIKADLMPEDKLKLINELKTSGRHTAMIGDGVNDAPALAAANVGIAMGGAGTDTALETADIALMQDDLKKLPYTIRLSRKTLNIIKQNITFALGLKILALILVVPGWLTLWIAIFADMGATLLVTLNSLRLLKIKDK